MSVQSRRKSRFRSFCDDDENGEGKRSVLQCYFIVSYVGETAWRDEFTYVNEIMENVLPKQVWSGKFWLKKEPQRKVSLSVDVGSTAVYIQNSEGIQEKSFKFCNIKEVIYCGNMKQYSKYVILVVSGEVDFQTKAHIFACGSVKEAKNAFKIFTDLFTHVCDWKPDFNLQVNDDVTKHSDDEISSSPHHALATDVGRGRQNSLSQGDQISPDIEDNFVENAFTALARSRSFNSGHGDRYTSCTRKQKQLRHYSSTTEANLI